MNRRDFLHTAAAGALAAGTQMAALAQKPNEKEPRPLASKNGRKRKPANLKLGTQHGDSDDILTVMAAFGVNHICAEPPSQEKDPWSPDALARKREHIESFGLHVDGLRLLHPTTIAK